MEILSFQSTGGTPVQMALDEVPSTTRLYDVKRQPSARPVPGWPTERYVPWGANNQLPYRIRELIGSDEVTAQNKLFNVLTCYGAGPRLTRPATEGSLSESVRIFMQRNHLPTLLLEQLTDLKYHYWSVVVFILSQDGQWINRIVHKDASFCRLQEADARGRIRHVYFGQWQGSEPKSVERIPLLDIDDPLTDLMRRTSQQPPVSTAAAESAAAPGSASTSPAIISESSDNPESCIIRPKDPTIVTPDGRAATSRKFAMLVRFPTVGQQYYPTPYYAAIFRGGSYDEKRLIAAAKTAKLRNHVSVKYQVEIERSYWERICQAEHISDPQGQRERIRREKEQIRDFVAGVHNSGKAWITGYYIDPMGHEVRDIRIISLEGVKEGGDYADDINAAANTLCYADNVHPNLVGAIPGKSQTNNSGSDKRELYVMKQALEQAWKDIALRPLQLVFDFNGYTRQGYAVELPIFQLTTLDEHRDLDVKH
ncbi:MAG: hypothetical protein IJ586_02120 [Alloprevotella sp.]|nr:hypothetical protein [Alloprevotella sp.]